MKPTRPKETATWERNEDGRVHDWEWLMNASAHNFVETYYDHGFTVLSISYNFGKVMEILNGI